MIKTATFITPSYECSRFGRYTLGLDDGNVNKSFTLGFQILLPDSKFPNAANVLPYPNGGGTQQYNNEDAGGTLLFTLRDRNNKTLHERLNYNLTSYLYDVSDIQQNSVSIQRPNSLGFFPIYDFVDYSKSFFEYIGISTASNPQTIQAIYQIAYIE